MSLFLILPAFGTQLSFEAEVDWIGPPIGGAS